MRLCFTLGVVGFVFVACGGSTFVVGGDGGASSSSSGSGSSSGGSSSGTLDGSVGDGASGDDGSTVCAPIPSNTGGEEQFCADESYIFTKCGNCEQCHKDDMRDCRTLGDVLSDGFKQAVHDCRDSNICGDYTTYATSPCVRAEFAQSKPTSAQMAAKNQYCQQCGVQNAGECANFFNLGGDAGTTTTSGIGVFVLMASDAIVDTMISGCNQLADCNPSIYEACTGAKLCAAAPPDNCKSGGCSKL